LKTEYDMEVDRRTVNRGLTDLIDLGMDIQYSEIPRIVKYKHTGVEEEQLMLTDFYLEREFCDCEIRLLIDELLDSKYIPSRQRKQLISKLEGLTSIYFSRGYARNKRLSELDGDDNQLFLTIDVLEEAIESSCEVSFRYKVSEVGKKGIMTYNYIEYRVYPYDIRIDDGKYLLDCISEDEEDLILKLDYIVDIVLENEKTIRSSLRNDKHICMVEFETTEDALDVFADEFGSNNLRVMYENEVVMVKVKTDEQNALDFCKRNIDVATLVSPASYREKIISRLMIGINRYGI
jgi:hypothetical protein